MDCIYFLSRATFLELRDEYGLGSILILRPRQEKEEWEYGGVKAEGHRPEVLARSESGESRLDLIERFREENKGILEDNIYVYEVMGTDLFPPSLSTFD